LEMLCAFICSFSFGQNIILRRGKEHLNVYNGILCVNFKRIM